MRHFNIFYLLVLIVGAVLVWQFKYQLSSINTELSFFGFAESSETEINYNYPVIVDSILVKPGQFVSKNDTLLLISRRKAKETLATQNFEIAELRAKETAWKQQISSEINLLSQEKRAKSQTLQERINSLQQELSFKEQIATDLKSIDSYKSDFSPLKEKIKLLQQQQASIEQEYEAQITALNKEMATGKNPYNIRVEQLNAELAFDEAQKIQHVVVTAPSDGLVGNVFCKVAEHIPSYTTLLTFYEPHSSLVRGYVHEDLTLQVKVGDYFWVRSLKNDTIKYKGTVIGLGSRIVEIPTRLRKMPEIKTYGREVLVEINNQNFFLQKEKVGLSYMLTSN